VTAAGPWIVVSARMASTRRPGKAMALLAGEPLLAVLLGRMRQVRGAAGVALATSVAPDNDPLERLARGMEVPVFRGDEDAAHTVRVTGDNPLTDIETAEALIAQHAETGADYTYVPGDALLMGILCEVISTDALARSWERGEARHRSELMTLYIKENPDEFKLALGALPEGLYRPEYRLTVDEPEDVRLMEEIFARLARPGHVVTTREAIALLDEQPELARINAAAHHKAANLRSVALDSTIVRVHP
jgi:spore coat polysaccharide biosynthesis protein SpsF